MAYNLAGKRYAARAVYYMLSSVGECPGDAILVSYAVEEVAYAIAYDNKRGVWSRSVMDALSELADMVRSVTACPTTQQIIDAVARTP